MWWALRNIIIKKTNCISIKAFIERCSKPMVIDTDALNIVAGEPDLLKKRNAATVITPHPGEFARLTGLSADEIRSDRINLALEYSRKWNVTVVGFKGCRNGNSNAPGEILYKCNRKPCAFGSGLGRCARRNNRQIGQGVRHDIAAASGVYKSSFCP